MEGRIESSDSSDSNSPYPANFKNTFWKELEAGRVNVFDNDMYSKVKKRSMTLQSRYKDQNSSTDEYAVKSETKKKQNLSNSDKTCQSKSSGSSSRRSKSTVRKRKATSDIKPDLDNVLNSSDTDQEMKNKPKEDNIKHTEAITIETESSDSEILKPCLNLVIKKIPEITEDMGKTSSVDGQETCSSYTVLPKSADDIQNSTGMSILNDI